MSGYREHSFDPNAAGEAFPQPPTWVQRLGIGCLFVGAAIIFAYLAGEWGVIPKWIGSPVPGTLVVVMAGPLMGVRRGPLSPEAKRRQLFILVTALAVCALAAITIFFFKGA